ncbi:MAG: hypothetical protein CL677_03565 [Bdellovibrionaceae bacterium]|nr:hypothetical protein [Pseudobdellovibrionaceae bacterium]
MVVRKLILATLACFSYIFLLGCFEETPLTGELAANDPKYYFDVVVEKDDSQAEETATFPIIFKFKFSKPINLSSLGVEDIKQSGTATGVVWSISSASTKYVVIVRAMSAATPGTIIPSLDLKDVVGSDGSWNRPSQPMISPVTFDPAPDAIDDSITVEKNIASTFAVLDNDTDNNTLNISAKTDGANGVVVINGDSTITYTPVADFIGLDSFTYTISDGLSQDTATVNVMVADAYTWVGAGSNTNWSNSQNWCGSISSGECQYDIGPPGTGNTAKFTEICPSCDVAIDSSVDIKGVRISSAYNGTITQASGIPVTVGTNHFYMESGRFVGSDAKIDINGYFEISGDAIFDSTSGTLEAGLDKGGTCSVCASQEGFVVKDSAVFNHNNGVVEYRAMARTANSSKTVSMLVHSDNPLTLNELIVDLGEYTATYNNSGVRTTPSSAVITVLSDMTIEEGVMWEGIYHVHGDLHIGYTNSNVKANGGNTQIHMVSSSPREIHFGDGAKAPEIVINTTSTVSPAAGVTNMHATALIVKNGTFNMPTGNFQLGVSNCNLTSTHNVDCSSNSGLHYEAGTINHNNGRVTIKGYKYFAGNASYPGDAATSTLRAELPLSLYNLGISVAENVPSRELSYVSVEGAGQILVENDLSLSRGTFHNGNIQFMGNLDIQCASADSCSHYGSTYLEWVGTTNKTYAFESGGGAPRLIINPSGSFSVSPAALTTDLSIGGLTILAGSFTAPTGLLNLNYLCGNGSQDLGMYGCNRSDGFVVASGATFIHNNGTTKFRSHYRSGTQGFYVDVDSSVDFYNLNIDVSDVYTTGTADYMTIAAGDTLNVENQLTLYDGIVNGGQINAQKNLDVRCTGGAGSTDCFYGGTTSIYLNGTGTQNVTQTVSSSIPGSVLYIDKSAGTVEAQSNITLQTGTQDLTFLQNGTLNLNAYSLSVSGSINQTPGSIINP